MLGNCSRVDDDGMCTNGSKAPSSTSSGDCSTLSHSRSRDSDYSLSGEDDMGIFEWVEKLVEPTMVADEVARIELDIADLLEW